MKLFFYGMFVERPFYCSKRTVRPSTRHCKCVRRNAHKHRLQMTYGVRRAAYRSSSADTLSLYCSKSGFSPSNEAFGRNLFEGMCYINSGRFIREILKRTGSRALLFEGESKNSDDKRYVFRKLNSIPFEPIYVSNAN